MSIIILASLLYYLYNQSINMTERRNTILIKEDIYLPIGFNNNKNHLNLESGLLILAESKDYTINNGNNKYLNTTLQ